MQQRKSESKMKFAGAVNTQSENVCSYDLVRWSDENYVVSVKVEVSAHKKGLADEVVHRCYPALADAAEVVVSIIDEKIIEKKSK